MFASSIFSETIHVIKRNVPHAFHVLDKHASGLQMQDAVTRILKQSFYWSTYLRTLKAYQIPTRYHH